MCSIVLDIDHAWSEGLVPQVDCSGYESMGVLGNVEDSADMRSLLIGYSGAIVWWHRSRLGRDGSYNSAAVVGFNVYSANNDCNLLTCESKNLGMSSILISIVSYTVS